MRSQQVMSHTKWRIIDILVVLGIYIVVMTTFYAFVISIFGSNKLNELNLSPSFLLFEGLIESVIFVFFPILIVTRIYHAPLREIGLENIVSNTTVWVGLISGAILWAAASLVDTLVENILGTGPTHPDLEKLKTTGDAIEYAVLLIPILVLTPIAEEVYMRGFVYTILRERYGAITGIVVSSLLFAAFHMSLWFFFQAFVVAIGLAWLREKYRTIGPAILAHATINLLAIIIGSVK